ncbi:MAG: hypothetical protein ACR2NA_01900 [Solirubrobacterales bacterium]
MAGSQRRGERTRIRPAIVLLDEQAEQEREDVLRRRRANRR